MWHWFQRLWRSDRPAGGPAGARGAAGERLAAAFLRDRLGYPIVARNWRNPRERREEIDLVCRDREVLVFVEVKTRSAAALVGGFRAVDRRKKRALRRAIHAYLTQLRVRPRTFRLDVVEIALAGPAPAEVRHFQNVPLFPRGYRVERRRF